MRASELRGRADSRAEGRAGGPGGERAGEHEGLHRFAPEFDSSTGRDPFRALFAGLVVDEGGDAAGRPDAVGRAGAGSRSPGRRAADAVGTAGVRGGARADDRAHAAGGVPAGRSGVGADRGTGDGTSPSSPAASPDPARMPPVWRGRRRRLLVALVALGVAQAALALGMARLVDGLLGTSAGTAAPGAAPAALAPFGSVIGGALGTPATGI
ncbi:MAG: hypothetical protein GXX90_04900, partial [Microbacteriaceae bacterium]|nr:hypothetical protein [Microbacteriaceae bacterium]